jgi:Flp pilus assembly pilin Flp
MWARYGQTMTEYALILAAITLGASCAFKRLGTTEKNSVTSAATEIQNSTAH